jgi:hypothetical protein
MLRRPCTKGPIISIRPRCANLWARAYLDGFSRSYRTVAEGPTGSQSIETLTAYNARGAMASEVAPFYANQTQYLTT